MKKIIVTGAGGQLSSEILALKDNYANYSFEFFDAKQFNIVKYTNVVDILTKIKPDFVINAAAYTAVDKAETEKSQCFEVNKIGAFNLARVSRDIGAHLVHISTDFVFDGTKSIPYEETDATDPISVYGNSKLQGENEIFENSDYYTIIRTSWLYSTFGHNFVKTMMKLGAEKESLNVVFDQIGTPTYARDLALVILDNLDNFKSKKALFHYSNEGVASWYDFAVEIMSQCQLPCHVSPILTAQYPTPAKRPSYSLMNKSKIKTALNINIPHWKSSLYECIQALSLPQSK